MILLETAQSVTDNYYKDRRLKELLGHAIHALKEEYKAAQMTRQPNRTGYQESVLKVFKEAEDNYEKLRLAADKLKALQKEGKFDNKVLAPMQVYGTSIKLAEKRALEAIQKKEEPTIGDLATLIIHQEKYPTTKPKAIPASLPSSDALEKSGLDKPPRYYEKVLQLHFGKEYASESTGNILKFLHQFSQLPIKVNFDTMPATMMGMLSSALGLPKLSYKSLFKQINSIATKLKELQPKIRDKFNLQAEIGVDQMTIKHRSDSEEIQKLEQAVEEKKSKELEPLQTEINSLVNDFYSSSKLERISQSENPIEQFILINKMIDIAAEQSGLKGKEGKKFNSQDLLLMKRSIMQDLLIPLQGITDQNILESSEDKRKFIEKITASREPGEIKVRMDFLLNHLYASGLLELGNRGKPSLVEVKEAVSDLFVPQTA